MSESIWLLWMTCGIPVGILLLICIFIILSDREYITALILGAALLICWFPTVVLMNTPVLDYKLSKTLPLIEINNCVGVFDGEEFINLTKTYGRTDIGPTTHVYKKYVMEGKSGWVILSTRIKYELVPITEE